MTEALSEDVRHRVDDLLVVGAPLGLSVCFEHGGWSFRSELAGLRSFDPEIHSAARDFRCALAIGFAGTNARLAQVSAPLRSEMLARLRDLEGVAPERDHGRRRRR